MVAVAGATIARLSGALGADAVAVRCVDMERLGGNPSRIIAAWQDLLDDSPGRRRAASASRSGRASDG